jgi:hypothetical protein
MRQNIYFRFKDTVRYIRKEQCSHRYAVTFNEQAAFYYVDNTNTRVIEILSRAQRERLEVEILHNIPGMEILNAELLINSEWIY